VSWDLELGLNSVLTKAMTVLCEGHKFAQKSRKANWIGGILRRNCLLKQITAEKIERRAVVTRRWGRRGKQLLYNLKEMRGYWKLKEEALYRTLWRTRF